MTRNFSRTSDNRLVQVKRLYIITALIAASRHKRLGIDCVREKLLECSGGDWCSRTIRRDLYGLAEIGVVRFVESDGVFEWMGNPQVAAMLALPAKQNEVAAGRESEDVRPSFAACGDRETAEPTFRRLSDREITRRAAEIRQSRNRKNLTKSRRRNAQPTTRYAVASTDTEVIGMESADAILERFRPPSQRCAC